jgi:hypothetical protein
MVYAVPSAVFKGDVELLVARAALVFHAVLWRIVQNFVAVNDNAHAHEALTLTDWYRSFVACTYYIFHLAHGVRSCSSRGRKQGNV